MNERYCNNCKKTIKDYEKHLDYHRDQNPMPRSVSTTQIIDNGLGGAVKVSALMPLISRNPKKLLKKSVPKQKLTCVMMKLLVL